MRALFFVLAALTPALSAGYTQQMIPVVRDVQKSVPAESVANTYLRVEDFQGKPYVSLTQMAVVFSGTLHWLPVSKAVEFSVHGRTVRFQFNSNRISLNGKRARLDAPTIKNEDGMWVPLNFFGSPSFYRIAGQRLDYPPPVTAKKAAGDLKGGKASTAGSPQKRGEVSVHKLPLTAPEVIPPSRNPAVEDSPPSETEALHSKAIRRVVIDPGHGGKDPGTVGPHGVEEKTMNLELAQALADELREQQGYEVLLTRTDDTFIPLAARAKLANKYDADLFISIHCNASLSSK